LWLSTADGGAPRLLAQVDTTGGVDSYSQPRLLPGGRAALFTMTARQQGESQLAVVRLDDRHVERLNVAGSSGIYLKSGHLLSVRSDGSAAMMSLDLRALKATGTPQVLFDSVLVTSGGRAPLNVSESGTLAYISGQTFEELVRVDRRGVVTHVYGRQFGRYATPRFSPTCDRVSAMTVLPGTPLRTDQVIYASEANRVVRLTNNQRSGTSAWIDAGRSLVWTMRARPRGDTGGPAPGLYRQNWDATGEPKLIRSEGFAGAVTSNADGTLLLFRGAGATTDLFVSAVDSGAVARLVSAPPGNKEGSVISPDGKWVAYAANDEQGRYEIYISPVQGPQARYRISSAGGTEPAWSWDSRSLYYRSSFSGNNNAVLMWDQPDWMLEAHLRLSPTPAAARIDSVFANPYSRYEGSRYYDVCRDGSFVMLRSGAARQRLVVITGWLDLVRRQLTGG
jgi:hypothetical protein